MSTEPVKNSRILTDPLDIYHAMIHDIEEAEKFIFLETFRFENDPIGIKFRNALTKKAKAGIEVILLLDDWGTSVSSKFFQEFIAYGGKLKYFKKIRLALNIVSANHERDHRKLLIIDDRIAYISSINISNYNLNWRESSLRLEGNIATYFKMVFLRNYRLKNSYKFDKRKHTKAIFVTSEISIYRDVPSVRIARIRKKLLQNIKKAQQKIIIESPYFLPTFLLREALVKAAKRGVNVKVIMPRRSDVTMVNIFRQRYLGKLHEAGIKILYYLPGNLHSKIMISDNQFYIGSANFDYRSFRYQFEIGLFGCEPNIFERIKRYNDETLKSCEAFDYQEWKKRKKFHKLIEWLLIPFRHFL